MIVFEKNHNLLQKNSFVTAIHRTKSNSLITKTCVKKFCIEYNEEKRCEEGKGTGWTRRVSPYIYPEKTIGGRKWSKDKVTVGSSMGHWTTRRVDQWNISSSFPVCTKDKLVMKFLRLLVVPRREETSRNMKRCNLTFLTWITGDYYSECYTKRTLSNRVKWDWWHSSSIPLCCIFVLLFPTLPHNLYVT